MDIDDSTVNHILIVTQTPPALRKHPGGDRTGDFQRRAKMTAELAKQIDEGLQFYEQDLFEEEERLHRMVSALTLRDVTRLLMIESFSQLKSS